MKFPYGIADFYKLITEGYFYVDRTDRIRLIEETGSQLLFLRPRRFGKSLTLSMLENYYDLAKADEFEALFGHLAIGQRPTERHNQYIVMKWDFSAVDAQGDEREIKQAMYNHINNRIRVCATYYQDLLPGEIEIFPTDALASLQSLLLAVQQTPYRLYLLIDEYDNFANELMMGGRRTSQERYEALLYGEGSLKAVFKAVKSASTGGGLDRVFITGVSPIVLSDITSGYNVAKNVYLDRDFNDLCGFSESEIADALVQIVQACHLPSEQAEEALTLMHTFYNGYRFSYDMEDWIYNPTLALYFLDEFQRYCQYPQEMLDSNLAMDRGKIAYISQLPGGESVILQALSEEEPLSVSRLAHRFGVEDMLYETKDTSFMVSLLYYVGALTLNGRTALGKLVLSIPNLVIRKLYVEQLQGKLLPATRDKAEALQVAERFCSTGEMQPLCEFLESRFAAFDNRDYRWSNELTVKTAFLVTLFNDTFYVMDSETELERDYADMTMLVRPDMRQYQLLDFLIEFKYVSLKELSLSGDEVRQMSRTELESLSQVQERFAASKAKLAGYRKTLENRYSDSLRLHSYSVVALGFERLAWTKLE